MATITRADGTTEDVGESYGEFKARQRVKVIKRTGKVSSREASTGLSQQEIINYYESKTAEASRERAEQQKQITEQSKIDPLIQAQPKGSYKVTRADGTVVYRTSGVSATGRYVKDVYQKIQEEKQAQKYVGQYKSIPKSAKKITTEEGEEVYRTFLKKDGKTFVTTYKPGGVKETKVLTKTFIGGSSQFIPKPVSKKLYTLPPTPTIDFALSQEPQKAGKGLAEYSERLVKREKRLSSFKENIYSKLRIKGQENAKWYNIKEIAKGVARAPFEIASIPSVIGGRVVFSARALFDPVGRKELKAGLTKTPGAVREVFVHRDPITGKYQLTAQNVVNIGLVAYSTRSIAKSPSNIGLKVYEKYAKTNIKGTITGYQGTTVFKSAGKLKGRPYQELTVFKGKASTTTIKTQGKTFIIKRTASGRGTYKILKPKTKIKVVRKAGIFPKKIRLEKELVVLKKGKFKAGDKPISFKTERGVTTQDIQLLTERGSGVQYIKYLEKLRTKTTGKGEVGKGLKFDAKAQIKVKADIQGVVTPKKIDITRTDFQTRTVSLTKELKKPQIKFADKPINPKDIIIRPQFIKEGQTIIGAKKGYIQQPRHVLRGPQDAFIRGEFTITGGKGFNIFKGLKVPKKPVSPIKTLTGAYRLAKLKRIYGKRLKPVKEKPTTIKATTRPTSKETTFDFSKSIIKRSKEGEQIALTEQIRAETYQIPFQAKAPKLEFQAVNFDIISAPLGKGKPLPLFPVSQTIGKETISLKPRLFEVQPTPRETPAYKVTTFQEVRPTNIYDAKSVIEQINQQKPRIDIKAGQRARVSDVQKPKSIIEQVQTQTQISTQIQTQKQITEQKSIFQNVFRQTPITATFQTPKFQQFAIPKPFAGFKPSFGVPKAPKGFDVFTRTKGAFKKINIRPLSKQDAINFGAFRVQTTARATFKIEEAPGLAQDVFRKQVSLKDFYKKDDLFIEKRERRIKSIGELQEITFKGIQSRKAKKIFGGL